MILAAAGTEIRDDNGDLVATLPCDIVQGQSVSESQFKLADGTDPIRGELMPPAVVRFVRNLR